MDKDKLWRENAKDNKFIASFSGGKDSSLALYKGMKVGHPVGLIVMMEENGERSRSHRITPRIIEDQAASIGLPVLKEACTWGTYEEKFIGLLEKSKEMGAEVLLCGDIEVPEENCWHEMVTNKVDMGLAMPLWKRNKSEVVREFVEAGFKAVLVTVNLSLGMKIEDLGRTLTLDYIKELEERGIDSCGEGGEFHTIVIDGPIFKKSIDVTYGEVTQEDEYGFFNIL